jgi:RNA 3'-terminal phosphate cyclase (ATP)
MIEINGSYGEGGGQILRTALGLSCLFQKPFRIFHIRKGRKKPGLMPQHLTCVRAAQLLSHADVKGDHKGSTELLFSPRQVKSGDFFFDIGTAGSTSLVLQTIIPSLVFLEEKSTVTLNGGTHVPFSPSFHYLKDVFASFLKKIGIEIQLTIDAYGFYPQGGGTVRATIFPAQEPKPIKITERGSMVRLRGYSGVGNLPLSIAERQRTALLKKIRAHMHDIRCPMNIELIQVPTPGQGTFLFLLSETEHATAGFTSLGALRKRAEVVGEEVAKEFLGHYATDAAIDPYIADQIVLYLSLSQKKSSFTTSRITQHLLTNLWVIGLFHEFHCAIEGKTGEPGVVKIN